MYSVITNPDSNKEASLDSKEGLEILKKYVSYLVGGSGGDKRRK